MGKRQDDRDVEMLTEDWVSVNKADDPLAWGAWTTWRQRELHCTSAPEALTVPTPWPPTTVACAKEYIGILCLIRASIGWKDSRSKIKTDVSAWVG